MRMKLSILLLVTSIAGFSGEYIQGRIPVENKRYSSLMYVFDLMEERGAKTLVETGTARGGARGCKGDGCSTILFAEYAKANEATLFSVDIDPHAIQEANNALGSDAQCVHLVTGDSVKFLQSFGRQIDFLYLDSYDYNIDKPKASQKHHLKEVKAAYPWLTRDTIIMIDDHDLPKGGKSKLAIEYLQKRGWVIAMEGYQVVLLNPSSNFY